MCDKRNCPCQWTDKDVTDLFVAVFGMAFTPTEEACIDTEPDIRRQLSELDQYQREEKKRRRGF